MIYSLTGIDFPRKDAYLSKMEKIGTELKTCRIGVLPISGFALMAYASTVEPFRAANVLSRRQLYEVINIGPTQEAIESSGVACVNPQVTIKQSVDVDYLFVVAGGNPLEFANREIFNWLLRMSHDFTHFETSPKRGRRFPNSLRSFYSPSSPLRVPQHVERAVPRVRARAAAVDHVQRAVEQLEEVGAARLLGLPV